MSPAPARASEGFRIDYGPVADAQSATQINVPSFVAADLAAGDVGEGLEQLGAGIGKIALSTKESVNRKAVDETDIQIATAQKEIGEAFAKEKDPTKWPEIFKTISGKWKEAALKNNTIGPEARHAIAQKFNLFELHGETSAYRMAHDQAITNEHDTLEGQRIAFARNGDRKGANGMTRTMKDRGLIGSVTEQNQLASTEKLVEQKEQDVKIAEYNRAEESVLLAARTRPTADVLAVISDPKFGGGKLSEDDRRKLYNTAQAAGNDATHQQLGEIADGIAAGTIKSDADLKAIKSPFFTPSIRQEAEKLLDKQNLIADANEREAHGSENFAKLYREAMEYSPSKDPKKTQFLDIITRARRFVGNDDDGLIRGIMYRKAGAVAPKIEPPQALKTAVKQSIGATFDVQLRPYKQAVEAAEDSIQKRDTKEAQLALTKAQEAYDAKNQELIKSQGAAQRKMDDWMKKNPQAKDTDVWKQVNEDIPDAAAPYVVDSLYDEVYDDPSPNAVPSPPDDDTPPPGEYKFPTYKQNPDGTVTQEKPTEEDKKQKKTDKKPGKVEPYEEPDLPTNPGSPSNILLPR